MENKKYNGKKILSYNPGNVNIPKYDLSKKKDSSSLDYKTFCENERKKEVLNLSSGYPITIPFNEKGLIKYVLLPDYSPLRKTPGVGTVTIFDKSYHEFNSDYLGSDKGCGILLGKFVRRPHLVESVASEFFSEENNKLIRSLVGGGNHFINIYENISSPDEVYVAIHTNENSPKNVRDINQEEAGRIGREKRRFVLEEVAKYFQEEAFPVLDNFHNTFEAQEDKLVYRKGAVKIFPGEKGFLPSSFNDDAIIFEATPNISTLENSICHGTGRAIPASKNPDKREEFRGIWEVEPLLQPYISVISRLRPLGVNQDYIYRIQRKVNEECKLIDNSQINRLAFDLCEGQRRYFGEKAIEPIGKFNDSLIMQWTLLNTQNTIRYLSKESLNLKNLKKDRFLALEEAFRKKTILERVLNL